MNMKINHFELKKVIYSGIVIFAAILLNLFIASNPFITTLSACICIIALIFFTYHATKLCSYDTQTKKSHTGVINTRTIKTPKSEIELSSKAKQEQVVKLNQTFHNKKRKYPLPITEHHSPSNSNTKPNK